VGRFFANSFGVSEDGLAISDLVHLAVDDTDPWDDAGLADVLRDLDAIGAV
jgi:hypothetical protein